MTTVNCLNCGASNQANTGVCMNCGQSIALVPTPSKPKTPVSSGGSGGGGCGLLLAAVLSAGSYVATQLPSFLA